MSAEEAAAAVSSGAADAQADAGGGADAGTAEQEHELKIEYNPIVPEVEVDSGERDEEVLLKLRSKLYRFDHELQQWKERGTGDVKILKHKETNRIRLLMRREKTFKVCGNHYLVPSLELREFPGNEKAWIWTANDFADGDVSEDILAIRFGSLENAQEFKKVFESSCKAMGDLLAAATGSPKKEGEAAASAAPSE